MHQPPLPPRRCEKASEDAKAIPPPAAAAEEGEEEEFGDDDYESGSDIEIGSSSQPPASLLNRGSSSTSALDDMESCFHVAGLSGNPTFRPCCLWLNSAQGELSFAEGDESTDAGRAVHGEVPGRTTTFELEDFAVKCLVGGGAKEHFAFQLIEKDGVPPPRSVEVRAGSFEERSAWISALKGFNCEEIPDDDEPTTRPKEEEEEGDVRFGKKKGGGGYAAVMTEEEEEEEEGKNPPLGGEMKDIELTSTRFSGGGGATEEEKGKQSQSQQRPVIGIGVSADGDIVLAPDDAENLDNQAQYAGPMESVVDIPPPYPEALVSRDSSELYVAVDDLDAAGMAELGVPTCCSSSRGFFATCGLCCVFGVLFPLVILLPIAEAESNPVHRASMHTFITTATVSAVIYLLYSMRHIFARGLPCTLPTAQPLAQSIEKADTGERRHVKSAPRRLFVIVNPNAGVKGAPALLDSVVLPIWRDRYKIDVTVLKTEYRGHGRDYARTISLDNTDGLCVIGGDGSYHDVVNGMFAREDGRRVPIGLLPGGSGNSVMLDCGTWNVEEAAIRIAEGDICWLDVNQVCTHGETLLSVNELSWGLVGDVGVVAEDFRWMGPGRYDAVAVWGVMKRATQALRISMVLANGETLSMEDHFLTAFVNQTQHFGKGLRACPSARMDDGLMDLSFMKDASRGALLAIFNQMPTGAHESNPDLAFRQVREVTLHCSGPGVVNIDGEIIKHDGTIHIKCLHKAMQFFIPPKYEPCLPTAAAAENH